MKKHILSIVIIVLSITFITANEWRLYTNTSHMRDLVMFDGNIAIATWGGIEFYDPIERVFKKKLYKSDGMSENDVITLANNNQDLYIGIKDKSVDRYTNGKFGIPLTQELGLIANKITKILLHNKILLVGAYGGPISVGGLSVFLTENQGLPFPKYINTLVTDRRTYDMTIDNENYLYLATNLGISKVHIDSLNSADAWKNKVIHYSSSESLRVFSIDYKNDFFLIATNRNIIFFHKNDYDNHANWKNYLDGNQFSKASIDFENDQAKLYAIYGTWGTTSSYHQNEYTNQDTLKSIAIISTCNDSTVFLTYGVNPDDTFRWPATNIYITDDELFITTWGDGLYHLEKSNLQVHKPPLSTMHTNNIRKLAVGDDGIIWIVDGLTAGTGTAQSANGISSINPFTNIAKHYTSANSGLISNNNYAVDVDAQNRKWFGTWWTTAGSGVAILDDSGSNEVWHRNTAGVGFPMLTPTISEIVRVGEYMWVCSNDGGRTGGVTTSGGINVIDANLTRVNLLRPPESINFLVTTAHKVNDRAYMGSSNMGVRTATSRNNFTEQNITWQEIPALNNQGYVHKIDSYSDENLTQVWFAMGLAVIYSETRHGSTSYYRIDSMFKRQIYSDPQNTYLTSQLYYEGEERLFGGEPTTPTAIKADPFGRIWIGSTDKGLSMYDIYEDRFTNYNTNNSVLPTNDITYLDYNPKTGLLYIGTKEGLVTYYIGKKEKTSSIIGNITVYPNPFRPSETNTVKIVNFTNNNEDIAMPKGKNECKIFDQSGQLIITLQENRKNIFEWDGKNSSGKLCGSGIYFYLIKTEVGKTEKGTIVLIR